MALQTRASPFLGAVETHTWLTPTDAHRQLWLQILLALQLLPLPLPPPLNLARRGSPRNPRVGRLLQLERLRLQGHPSLPGGVLGRQTRRLCTGSGSSFTPFSRGKQYDTARKYLNVAGRWLRLSGSFPFNTRKSPRSDKFVPTVVGLSPACPNGP